MERRAADTRVPEREFCIHQSSSWRRASRWRRIGGATGCCGVEGTEVAVTGNGAFAPPGETASEGAEHVARDLPLHCE